MLRATKSVLRATGFVLRATKSVLRAAGFALRATKSMLRATGFVLRATKSVLYATGYMLRATKSTRASGKNFYNLMLRMVYIYVLRIDAGRHLIWITPCKPKAQLGVWAAFPDPNCEAVQPRYGVEVERRVSTLPRAAPSACTGLSKLDAFRRQFAVYKNTA
jgi:hypothetical protein